MATQVILCGDERIKTTVAVNRADIDNVVKAFLSNSANFRRIIGISTEESLMLGCSPITPKTRIDVFVLCDGYQCLVVQSPSASFLPNSLFNFLNLPGFIFMGVGIHKTIAKLHSQCGLSCKDALEIGPSSWGQGAFEANYRQIYSKVMSMPCLSNAVLDNWGKGLLSDDQITLAVGHAYAAFKLGESLVTFFYK